MLKLVEVSLPVDPVTRVAQLAIPKLFPLLIRGANAKNLKKLGEIELKDPIHLEPRPLPIVIWSLSL